MIKYIYLYFNIVKCINNDKLYNIIPIIIPNKWSSEKKYFWLNKINDDY